MFKSLCQSISGNPKLELSVEIYYCFVLGQSVSLTALTPSALNLSTIDNQLPADPLPAQIQTCQEESKGTSMIGRPFILEQRRGSVKLSIMVVDCQESVDDLLYISTYHNGLKVLIIWFFNGWQTLKSPILVAHLDTFMKRRNVLRLVFLLILVFIDLVSIPYVWIQVTVTEEIYETKIYATPPPPWLDSGGVPQEVQTIVTNLSDSFKLKHPNDTITYDCIFPYWEKIETGLKQVWFVIIYRTYKYWGVSNIELSWMVLINILILLIIIDPTDLLKGLSHSYSKREPRQLPLASPTDKFTEPKNPSSTKS